MLHRALTPSLPARSIMAGAIVTVVAAVVAILVAPVLTDPGTMPIALAGVPVIAPSANPPRAAPTTSQPPVVTDNEFLPENRDITDCVSAVPKPGCGSKARGGWRQGLVALALLAGLCFIGWRIAKGVRRPARSHPGTPAPADRDPNPGS